jgi:hypothetical protein
MPNYRTCTHTDDSGHTCKSAAAKGRDFCGFHLRYRGRLLRQAQYRARHQRFDLTLPPLDSLCSIQSALCQVAEALAADMIDPRRAQGLLKALRFAKENLRDSLKENSDWHATPYHTEDAEAYDNFESDYGLPDNLDVSAPPEVSFPSPPLEPPLGVILSGGGFAAGVEGPAFDLSSRAQRSGVEGPAFSPATPYIRDYMAEAEEAMQTHPEDIELEEVMKKYGYKAWDNRAKEHQRNERRRRQRKYFRANYDRFVAEANARNIQRAAERLYQERVAAERSEAAKKPPTSTSEPTPEEAKNTA